MHIAQGTPISQQLRRGLLQLGVHSFERRNTPTWTAWTAWTRRHSSSLWNPDQVIFSGIQPTGIPHLGNYFGALQQWVKIQDGAPSTTDLLFSIVDLHAMTLPYDRNELRLQKRQTLAALLAIGLNPQRSTIFFQSASTLRAERVVGAGSHRTHVDFELHGVGGLSLPHDTMEGLSYILLVAYVRMLCHLTTSRSFLLQSKLAMSDSIALSDPDAKAKLKLGLFSYPVLQSADILLYQYVPGSFAQAQITIRRATHVPVGHDQAQHLEFARENAKNFNTAHGHFFCEPQTIISPANRVMSLRDPRIKMSKSHEDPKSRLLLNDDAGTIQLKIKAALTDSINGLSYDPIERPGVSNLLALMSHMDSDHRSVEQIISEGQYLSMHIRAGYDYYMSASQARYLQEVAAAGNEAARLKAERTMTP
ncbi:MAG: hypothetical protein Q9205_007128, partial [Flavoplaca limonia]